MKRNFFKFFGVFIKGLSMGLADLVPGVSGGTIAFITGIYEELISSISELKFSLIKDYQLGGIKLVWSKINAPFLITLFFGIVVSVLIFSSFISWILNEHPILTWSFFFGLILSSIFYFINEIKKWNLIRVSLILIGILITFGITRIENFNSSNSYLYIFVSGIFAICAMILPGISGALVLVIMGTYKNILQAINNKEVFKIISFGLGALIGLITFSKILKFLFNNYKNETLSILTGFMSGALIKIWPWKRIINNQSSKYKNYLHEECISPFSYDGDPMIFQAIISMFIGFILIFIFNYLSRKQKFIE